MEFFLAGLILVVPLLVYAGLYNRLVRLRHLVRESWANVDVQLKRRHDLIPNLVRTAQAYATHEAELFAQVTHARERASAPHDDPAEQAQDENALVRPLNTLLARLEAYPALQASQAFLDVQRELVSTEDRIAAARRFYNANVREFNTAQEVFPMSLVAQRMRLKPASFFEIESLATARLRDHLATPITAPPIPSPNPQHHQG